MTRFRQVCLSLRYFCYFCPFTQTSSLFEPLIFDIQSFSKGFDGVKFVYQTGLYEEGCYSHPAWSALFFFLPSHPVSVMDYSPLWILFGGLSILNGCGVCWFWWEFSFFNVALNFSDMGIGGQSWSGSLFLQLIYWHFCHSMEVASSLEEDLWQHMLSKIFCMGWLVGVLCYSHSSWVRVFESVLKYIFGK